MLELPIGEVSVRWSEIEGSKLNPIVDAVKMFRDIALLWLRYAIGAWKLPSKQE
jgi:dolichyl-phosphate beta-glucosyltransferase